MTTMYHVMFTSKAGGVLWVGIPPYPTAVSVSTAKEFYSDEADRVVEQLQAEGYQGVERREIKMRNPRGW